MAEIENGFVSRTWFSNTNHHYNIGASETRGDNYSQRRSSGGVPRRNSITLGRVLVALLSLRKHLIMSQRPAAAKEAEANLETSSIKNPRNMVLMATRKNRLGASHGGEAPPGNTGGGPQNN